MNLPSWRKLHDARVRAFAMAIGYEDVAVRSYQHGAGAVESVGAVAGHAGLAERQKNLAVRAEFKDLFTLAVLGPARRWPKHCRSLSTKKPWGCTNMPAPKLLTIFPEGENSKIGSSELPAQVAAPHRSTTQIFPVFWSMSIALADPHFLPCGICAHFSWA